ncbi:DUF4258 domain-containing protein [Marinobacter sp. Arc7-DN-1]|uniref:DUF4258 domain-containing protein n=1 Tax=Marinobacter sp. Arc7-DN-1 TaxID=2304594 RepID=UPI000E433FCE|nr:DUF4258 domain-containing protein [Marinobacter sp. Arc7-DN-1]
MHCQRFGLDLYITRHASERMIQRGVSDAEIAELMETGEIRYQDNQRLWVAKAFEGRCDNLICVAVALEDRLVVKTVMHHFSWEVEG